MKYLVIIPEGIADFPSKKFDDKTPLELARTPFLDTLALNGRCGMCKPTPSSCFPGSHTGFSAFTANNPAKLKGGRGYYEALGLGLDISQNKSFFRVNLITVQNDKMVSYGSASFTNDECIAISNTLNQKFEDLPLKFYPLSGYRMLLEIENDWLCGGKKNNLKTYHPPSDLPFVLSDNYPKGNGRDKIIEIIENVSEVLSDHDINQIKIDLSENPANGIWIWGNSVPKKIKNFNERFSINAFCISSSHLIRGIALSVGVEASNVIHCHVGGAKIYEERVDSALQALNSYELVFLHVENINDVSKLGDLHKKCQSIESFDEKVIGTSFNYLKEKYDDFRILVASSHPFGIEKKIPTRGATPWVLYGSGVKSDKATHFNEKECSLTRFRYIDGYNLLKSTLFQK